MFQSDIQHAYLESTAAASQNQNQRREIRRPPPFIPNFNSANQESSPGAKDQNDGNVAVQDSKYFDVKFI